MDQTPEDPHVRANEYASNVAKLVEDGRYIGDEGSANLAKAYLDLFAQVPAIAAKVEELAESSEKLREKLLVACRRAADARNEQLPPYWYFVSESQLPRRTVEARCTSTGQVLRLDGGVALGVGKHPREVVQAAHTRYARLNRDSA